MSEILKIKSITIIKDYPNRYFAMFMPLEEQAVNYTEYLKINEIAKNYPEFFKIEYEKPKNNVLYAVVEPEKGVEYAYISDTGIIDFCIWEGDIIDQTRFNLNNVFIGADRDSNAQKQADRIKLLAKIERFAVENNEVIDWSDTYQYKSCLSYNWSDKKWVVTEGGYYQLFQITYFTSTNLANQTLEKFKDRLDILLD